MNPELCVHPLRIRSPARPPRSRRFSPGAGMIRSIVGGTDRPTGDCCLMPCPFTSVATIAPIGAAAAPQQKNSLRANSKASLSLSLSLSLLFGRGRKETRKDGWLGLGHTRNQLFSSTTNERKRGNPSKQVAAFRFLLPELPPTSSAVSSRARAPSLSLLSFPLVVAYISRRKMAEGRKEGARVAIQ